MEITTINITIKGKEKEVNFLKITEDNDYKFINEFFEEFKLMFNYVK